MSLSKGYHAIGMTQWTVERGTGAGIPINRVPFAAPHDGVFPSGYVLPLRQDVPTSELSPGAYELVLTVKDCADKVVGVRRQKFRVVN